MASRRANRLYNMMLKYRDETAIKKLKKAKKTDTDEQVVLKVFIIEMLLIWQELM